MSDRQLRDTYQSYLDCLNRRDWDQLGHFVATTVSHNGRNLGLTGYRAMLEQDCDLIPDLFFQSRTIVCEPPWIAAILAFECSPKADFLGLSVNGRRVSFTENVFYKFDGGKIVSVLSVIDKAAIEAQL